MKAKRTRSADTSLDLVPLADRLRNIEVWRAVVVALVALSVLLWPQFVVVTPAVVAAISIAYLVIAAGASRVASRAIFRSRWPFSVLLLVDASFLVLVAFGFGEPGSPLRYLLVLHAVQAALLASFRTGLKLALWQSLMVSAIITAGPRLFPESAALVALSADKASSYTLLVICWASALSTAAMAAVNERELRRRRYDLEALAEVSRRFEQAESAAALATTMIEAVHDEFALDRMLVLVPGGAEEFVTLGARIALDPPTSPSSGTDVEPAATATAPAPDAVDPSTAPSSGPAAGPTAGPSPTVSPAEVAALAEPLAVRPGSVLAEVLGADAALLVDGLDPDLDGRLAELLAGATNLLLLPIRTQRGVGVFVAEHGMRRGSRIERRVVSMLERYVDQLGLRLTNIWLVETLREAATTDRLTGVANRGRFNEVLPEEMQRSVRTRSPLCLLIVDLDHFKSINDRFGHAAGDEVLRAAAGVLRSGVRPYDIVARYGGEEFVVVLPGSDLTTASGIAERLRAALPESTGDYRVTASMGLARFEPSVDDPDLLVQRADAALYESKHNGRNRITIAEDPRGSSVATTDTM